MTPMTPLRDWLATARRAAAALCARPTGPWPLFRGAIERAAGPLRALVPFRRGPDAPAADLSGDWQRPVRLGFGVVAVTFGALGGWASLAELDSAVVASGAIVVESERKAVQHLEGGIVREILVAENAHVTENEVLVRFDTTQARAGRQMARLALFSALAEEARLLAEAEGDEDVAFPDELRGSLDEPDIRRVADDQRRQFRERRSSRWTETAILQERIAQAQRQIEGAQAQREAALQQMDSLADEAGRLRPLAAKGLVPLSRVATLDRQAAELKGRVGALDADGERLLRSIGEARFQVEQVARRAAEEVSGTLAQTRAKLADAREKLAVAEDVLARNDVRAPRSGRVVGLKVHTIGAVARPGDTLMEVVPEEDALLVAAKMSPVDVNNVRAGLPAEVRLPSFKARTTPVAIGEVRSVAADALRDEVTRQPYYELRISVQVSRFPDAIRSKLKPGMPAEILVATGERTVLAYLLQPLGDAMRRGMREN